MKSELRLVFMGTPEFAVPILGRLVLDKYRVAAVCTQPDRPAGRQRSVVSSPVKRAAQRWNLPVIQPASLKAPETVAQLNQFHPDVIVVAAFGQILPPVVLGIPGYGCVNVHPSLLPRYRGASPVAAAILAGDEFTGASIMLMDEGLDTGPVLARAAIPVSSGDTTGTLTGKLSLISAMLLQEVLVSWPRHEITPQPQDEAGATLSRTIIREEGEIDWRLPAADIWRRVRAYSPWPGGYTRWRGKHLKIIKAVALPGGGPGVGQAVVVNNPDAAFGISTGDGILGVVEVQLEGKRAMTAAEFLRGQRDFIGSVLPG